MALILVHQRKIRKNKITMQDKNYSMRQILNRESMQVMQKARQNAV